VLSGPGCCCATSAPAGSDSHGRAAERASRRRTFCRQMFSVSPAVECGTKHQEKVSDVVPAIGRDGCEVPHEVRRQAHLRTRCLICPRRISWPVAATTRVAPGPGNPRTPAPAPSVASSVHQPHHLSAELGRMGWSCFDHRGLPERNFCAMFWVSTVPAQRIYWTRFVTAMSLEPIGRCYGRWWLAARPWPRAL